MRVLCLGGGGAEMTDPECRREAGHNAWRHSHVCTRFESAALCVSASGGRLGAGVASRDVRRGQPQVHAAHLRLSKVSTHSVCAAVLTQYVLQYSLSMCCSTHSVCVAVLTQYVLQYSLSMCCSTHSVCAAVLTQYVLQYLVQCHPAQSEARALPNQRFIASSLTKFQPLVRAACVSMATRSFLFQWGGRGVHLGRADRRSRRLAQTHRVPARFPR